MVFVYVIFLLFPCARSCNFLLVGTSASHCTGGPGCHQFFRISLHRASYFSGASACPVLRDTHCFIATCRLSLDTKLHHGFERRHVQLFSHVLFPLWGSRPSRSWLEHRHNTWIILKKTHFMTPTAHAKPEKNGQFETTPCCGCTAPGLPRDCWECSWLLRDERDALGLGERSHWTRGRFGFPG